MYAEIVLRICVYVLHFLYKFNENVGQANLSALNGFIRRAVSAGRCSPLHPQELLHNDDIYAVEIYVWVDGFIL